MVAMIVMFVGLVLCVIDVVWLRIYAVGILGVVCMLVGVLIGTADLDNDG